MCAIITLRHRIKREKKSSNNNTNTDDDDDGDNIERRRDNIHLHVVALFISIVHIKCVTASIINTNQLNYVV